MSKKPEELAGTDHGRTDVEARIRARAYEIYLSRGGTDGAAEADWLAAEHQILGARARTSADGSEPVPPPSRAPRSRKPSRASPTRRKSAD